MKEIKLNGVAFNLQAVANYSNAEDFYSSPSHQHYWGNITQEERHKRLIFVYQQAKSVSRYNDMPVTEINILDVDKENNTMTVEAIQTVQGNAIFASPSFNAISDLLNDSSATDNKSEKSKRSRRNSKDAD
jgi:succinyl-CoA synthetase beta subunit